MKIAIFGMARSGICAFDFIHEKKWDYLLIDQGEFSSWKSRPLLEGRVDENKCFDQNKVDLAGVNLFILSPGIPRTHPLVKLALKMDISVISEIEFTYLYSDIPIIAITGTNGKTTTATMVAKALELSGLSVFLGGNIGNAYSKILTDKKEYDYAVVELSSFQLESIEKFRPKMAMILNVTLNHTERYDDFSDYLKAKKNIYKNMQEDDFLIIDEKIEQEFKGNVSFIRPYVEADYSKSFLVGEHNLNNFFCAYQCLKLLKIKDAKLVMQNLINSFGGVEYRLQFIKEVDGLKIYNDSKSTNDAATLSAVEAFSHLKEDFYLIVGGKLRSDDITLAQTLQGKRIKKVLLIGEASQKLKETVSQYFDCVELNDLNNVMKWIKENRPKGNLVFSPGFPSFDQYQNFEKRGEDFTSKVRSL